MDFVAELGNPVFQPIDFSIFLTLIERAGTAKYKKGARMAHSFARP